MIRRLRCAAVLAIAAAAAPIVAGAAGQPPTPPASAATFDVQEKSIAELQAALTTGTVTSRSLVLSYLARIRAYDQLGPQINAMITMNPRILEAADALDRERALVAGHLPGAHTALPFSRMSGSSQTGHGYCPSAAGPSTGFAKSSAAKLSANIRRTPTRSSALAPAATMNAGWCREPPPHRNPRV